MAQATIESRQIRGFAMGGAFGGSPQNAGSSIEFGRSRRVLAAAKASPPFISDGEALADPGIPRTDRAIDESRALIALVTRACNRGNRQGHCDDPRSCKAATRCAQSLLDHSRPPRCVVRNYSLVLLHCRNDALSGAPTPLSSYSHAGTKATRSAFAACAVRVQFVFVCVQVRVVAEVDHQKTIDPRPVQVASRSHSFRRVGILYILQCGKAVLRWSQAANH